MTFPPYFSWCFQPRHVVSLTQYFFFLLILPVVLLCSITASTETLISSSTTTQVTSSSSPLPLPSTSLFVLPTSLIDLLEEEEETGNVVSWEVEQKLLNQQKERTRSNIVQNSPLSSSSSSWYEQKMHGWRNIGQNELTKEEEEKLANVEYENEKESSKLIKWVGAKNEGTEKYSTNNRTFNELRSGSRQRENEEGNEKDKLWKEKKKWKRKKKKNKSRRRKEDTNRDEHYSNLAFLDTERTTTRSSLLRANDTISSGRSISIQRSAHLAHQNHLPVPLKLTDQLNGSSRFGSSHRMNEDEQHLGGNEVASNDFGVWEALLSTFLALLIIFTIVGNLFVIVAISIERNLRTMGNYLVFSLAVADVMVAVCVMPFAAIYNVSGKWTLGPVLCDIWTAMDVLSCTASILHLVAIATDRYWAVTNVDYITSRTNKSVGSLIFAVWSVAVIVSIAPIFGWKDDDYSRRIVEDKKCQISQDISYQIFATMSTFYAPLVVILLLYWKIFQVSSTQFLCNFVCKTVLSLHPVPQNLSFTFILFNSILLILLSTHI